MAVHDMSNLVRSINRIEESGLSLKIRRGGSLHSIEHSMFVPDLNNQVPVEFDIEYRGQTITLRVRLKRVLRLSSDFLQLAGILESHYRGEPVSKRLTRNEATVFIGNYNVKERTGFLQVAPFVMERIREGEVLF